jgi:hypothetical protein
VERHAVRSYVYGTVRDTQQIAELMRAAIFNAAISWQDLTLE